MRTGPALLIGIGMSLSFFGVASIASVGSPVGALIIGGVGIIVLTVGMAKALQTTD